MRLLFLGFYLLILLLPGYIFFDTRGGFAFLNGSDFKTFASLTFPLFGLYAFVLLWVQLMIGTNIIFLTRLFPRMLNFHRAQGIFVLLLAFTHQFFILSTYSLEKYVGLKFLPEEQRIFGLFGMISLYLLLLSATAAILRRTRILRKIWRYIHYLNYLIFVLVWLHSWYLGSDVQNTNLVYLWYFIGASGVVSSLIHLINRYFPQKTNVSKPNEKEVASVQS